MPASRRSVFCFKRSVGRVSSTPRDDRAEARARANILVFQFQQPARANTRKDER